MSHRLTKEQLDEQFELFLKESDSGDSEKQLGVKSSQKYSQKTKASWWQDEEPSGGGAGREMAKKRFIKSKKAKPENTTVVSVDPVLKPVPKPRCKPPDQPVQLDNTHSDAVLEGSPDDPLSEDPPADSFHSPSQRDSGDDTGMAAIHAEI